ncbi:MAG: GDYXXLXY domain-containing protein [Terricaulis sp.]
MKLNTAPRIMIVAAACAIALVGVVLLEGAARGGGQEVLLPMQAVDPRDMLSGHYVQIALNQTLQPTEHCPDEQSGWDWVALRPIGGGAYAVAGGAHSRDQTEQIGPVSVKGSFSCMPPTPPGSDVPEGQSGNIRLEIGVDRFYINQAEAERIDQILRDSRGGEARAFAIVSVGSDGQARLKGVQIDGKRLELSWL